MVACAWCGEEDADLVLRGTWARGGALPTRFAVLRCRQCGLARTDPTPDVERYDRGQSIWTEGVDGDVWSARIARDVVTAPGLRLLDIGCNTGNLVEAAARLGAHAEGIDLDPLAVERGRAAGRNIHHRPLAGQEGEWDRIVLNHVLEHVVDLRGFLAHLDRVAAPEAIVTIKVPCYEGLIPRLMGDHWFAWAPDEHVWHFTPKTLRAVVEVGTSLRAVRVQRRGFIEPGSSGVKGIGKTLVSRAASAINWGDQVAAMFVRR